MFDFAKDLKEYYENQSGYTNTFIGKLSTTVDDCIVFYDSGGEQQRLVHSPDSTGLKHPTLQVRVRGDTNAYETTRERAEDVYSTLHDVSDITINSHTYQRVVAVSDPIWLGYDSNNRPEWSINFEIVI